MDSFIMGSGFDLVFGALAIICGIMCLTGHGEIFMGKKAQNSDVSKYDEKKVLFYSGICILLIGIGSFAHILFASRMADIIFLIFVVIMVIAMAVLIQLKAKKSAEQMEEEAKERQRKRQALYHGGTKKIKK